METKAALGIVTSVVFLPQITRTWKDEPYLWSISPLYNASQNNCCACWIEPVKKESICSTTVIRQFNIFNRQNITNLLYKGRKWQAITNKTFCKLKVSDANLLVAITIPRRSRISPINAYFTTSDRNIASGVDSNLMKTLFQKNLQWEVRLYM